MNNLELIKKLYAKYIGDPVYVYKKCSDCSNDQIVKWLLILKKIPIDKKSIKVGRYHYNAIQSHNQYKKIIDEKYAGHYATENLELVLVIDVDNPHFTRSSIQKSHRSINITYSIGSIIDFYDLSLDDFGPRFLYYFITVDAAYFHWNVPSKHEGYVYQWWDSGQKRSEGEFSKGLQVGKWIYYPLCLTFC